MREYEVRGGNVFLVAPVLAGAWTCDVPDGRSFGHQKRAAIEIGHGEKPRWFDRRRTTKPLPFARRPAPGTWLRKDFFRFLLELRHQGAVRNRSVAEAPIAELSHSFRVRHAVHAHPVFRHRE